MSRPKVAIIDELPARHAWNEPPGEGTEVIVRIAPELREHMLAHFILAQYVNVPPIRQQFIAVVGQRAAWLTLAKLGERITFPLDDSCHPICDVTVVPREQGANAWVDVVKVRCIEEQWTGPEPE